MIVVSHRGPYSFTAVDGGGFNAKRGAGGIVSALAPLLEDPQREVTWIAAAISDDDAAACAAGAATVADLDLRLLTLDAEMHRLHYDVVSNEILWFLHHGLFGLGHDPTFDTDAFAAIDAYYEVNERFAAAVCECAPPGDIVLVQDYQLALVPAMIRRQRHDLHVQHFTHTPFCGPHGMRLLPDPFARDLLRSLNGGPAGFHTERWAAAYRGSVGDVLGEAPNAFVAPLGPDIDELRRTASSPEVAAERRALEQLVGDRRVIVRADRIEPSKNITRGFKAYEQFLINHPEWSARVVLVALLYPSRQSLPLYRTYADEVHEAIANVNTRFATSDWQPVILDERDSFARTVAGFQLADVVFVNPVTDGLNLVAKEAPLVNERDAVLCLSRDAGAHDELAEACETLHPFDIVQQSEAIARALDLDHHERTLRAARLRKLAAAHNPSTWLAALLVAS